MKKNTKIPTVKGDAENVRCYNRYALANIEFQCPETLETIEVQGEFHYDKDKNIIYHTHYDENDRVICEVQASF